MVDDGVIPSSLCHCSDRKAVHVHCFCGVCNGKAVNYRTQISHLTSSAFYGTERTEEQLLQKVLVLAEIYLKVSWSSNNYE